MRRTWQLYGAAFRAAVHWPVRPAAAHCNQALPGWSAAVCGAGAAAAALALQAGFTGVVGWNWLMGQPSLLAANATTTLNHG